MSDRDIQAKIDGIISSFDQKKELFSEHQVWDALCPIRKSIPNGEILPKVIKYEMLAFELVTRGFSGESRTYENLEEIVDQDTLDYWAVRAKSLTNPLLIVQYADAAWHFGKTLSLKVDYTLALLVIDSGFDILATKQYEHELDAIWYAKRSLELALQLNDRARINKAITEMISLEDAVAIDSKAGRWGFSFDHILNNKKTSATDIQKDKILQDMEARYKRLTTSESLNLLGAERALGRLLPYYRALDDVPNAERILLMYRDAVIASLDSSDEQAMAKQSRVQDLYELLFQNGLSEEAQSLEHTMLKMGEKVRNEMQVFSAKLEITNEQLEQYIAQFTQADLSAAFQMIAAQFLIGDKNQIREDLEKHIQAHPLIYLFGHTLLDDDGRIIGKAGDAEADIDYHILSHASQKMSTEGFFLNKALKGIFKHFSVTENDVLDYLSLSPAFKPENKEFLEAGVRAYLRGEHITAAHILIPQIEGAIRTLCRKANISILILDAKTKGTEYRTLGALLSSKELEIALGEAGPRITFYLRLVLTEKFAWNLRNLICHGLMKAAGIGYIQTDRLFHILLLLGVFR